MESPSLVLLVLFFTLEGHMCLRDVHLRVPAAVRTGDSLTISCSYTTEQEKLYSAKFYLGDTEFYRFVPKDNPPTRVFGINGLSITLQESRLNMSTVTLHNVHRDMTGYYKCEVSADAPFFQTIIKSTLVTVTEEPLGSPMITTDKHSYGLGETINANCTSKGGFPLANLTWLLNGKQVTKIVKQHVLEGDVDSSVLQLRLHVTSGPLRLRCVATQFSLYQEAVDLILKEETPDHNSLFDNTEPTNVGYIGKERLLIADLLLSSILLLVYTQ